LAPARERLTLWRWSYPRMRIPVSPLAGLRFERPPGLNLGLLHCDRDQPGSPYAAAMSRELDAPRPDGWLLGHVHRPDALTAPSPSGYLGSGTGMDPGEAGPRGPWLITIDGGRIRAVGHWTLAPLRWELLAVDLTGVADQGEIQHRLLRAI